MKKRFFLFAGIVAIAPLLYSFCGFYVSKADGTLKNKTSQVIIVRNGNRNVITMYNDFKGDTRDFAMVVPVPVVLKQSNIKVVDAAIFQRLNDYSAPRLVEYYDQNPCNEYEAVEDKLAGKVPGVQLNEVAATGYRKKEDLGVKIEAKYLVGEYDILILSAKESTGLKKWLTDNGYKIPAAAGEVLDPYIKSNLKFFVVKVNEKEMKKLNNQFLRPIQIHFSSPKFMLPIRLGMANADGDQDLIVYAFSTAGRVECTNYRNVNIPTDKNIPLFVQKNFATFYSNLFTHQWKNENKNVAVLEYAWDVSPQNYVKCDPCVAAAPSPQDLLQSGVWWLQPKDWSDYSDVAEEADEPYEQHNKVHFTRMHFRYNRQSFPQDLYFQTTPNEASFQARYIITHPATGNLDCTAGKQYLKTLKEKRKRELAQLTALTGTSIDNWQNDMLKDELGETDLAAANYPLLANDAPVNDNGERKMPAGLFVFSLALIGGAGLLRYKGFI
jgi:hypothetical protein